MISGTDGSNIQDDRLAAVKDVVDQEDDSDNRISTEQPKNKKKSKDVAKKIKRKTSKYCPASQDWQWRHVLFTN